MSSILDQVWDDVVGGAEWLKEVVYGEFDDKRDISAMIARMLLDFVPGVIIVTSARDLTAVIIRLAKHPERRDKVEEWMLLIACVIPLALPLLAAAAGAAAAGVGAVVGGIAGSEVGAVLRATCLMLIEEGAKMLTPLITYLRRFIKGDVLTVLRDIKFAQYGEAIAKTTKQAIDGLLVVVQKLSAALRRLDWFNELDAMLAKLKKLETAFYEVQEAAIKKIPSALAELDSRLQKALSEVLPQVKHDAIPEIPAPPLKSPPVPEPKRVTSGPGEPLGDPPGTSAPEPLPPETKVDENRHPQKVARKPRRSAAEVDAWASKFPTKNTPNNSARDAYEIKNTGPVNTQVEGGGQKIWADGVSSSDGELQEAKYIGNPDSSPYIDGSNCPPFLRDKMRAEADSEVSRYGAVINDPNTPVTGLQIITNDPKAVPYFQSLLQKYSVPGEVVVKP